ncbi:hypothetical protein LTSEINV_5090, partial [Salmonella enterica subsp. enterica serovar Inverness str. R8-3668]
FLEDSGYMAPRAWRFSPSLPPPSSGKTARWRSSRYTCWVLSWRY